jgi:hypothetical protein
MTRGVSPAHVDDASAESELMAGVLGASTAKFEDGPHTPRAADDLA